MDYLLIEIEFFKACINMALLCKHPDAGCDWCCRQLLRHFRLEELIAAISVTHAPGDIMSNKGLLQIRSVDIQDIFLPADTDCLTGIPEWYSESAAFIIDESIE